MKVLSLKCVNCGAGLEVKQDIDDFACGYCGVQQHVERSGSIVSLSRLEDALDDVKLGTNRAASELALERLQTDVVAIYKKRDREVRALLDANHKNNVRIGLGLTLCVAFSMGIFGPLYGMPLIFIGCFIGSRFMKSVARDKRAIEANAEATASPLKAQIARHQSIIDSYDFGTQGAK
ncbi:MULTISPECIES: hypothetical protein [unclassified Duganella]|uniref:hypothetical protein n=1 Tax=unclassified Duganella TaxID=2636909 RepID=UPI0006F23AC6|nr:MULTISPECIES: hypothetical protein [unclassified Duganella]KQV45405.1 hypothetical protein ASD07_17990 [Duganella sp. Root336D2]KRB93622.1 hypothetical protein ASE26_27635 [Duganella sp. Root198D2]